MKKLMYASALAIIALGMTNCNDDEGPSTSQLTMNISGLEDLGSSAVYEGWVIVDGSPVSTGTFTVNGSGVPSATSFDVAAEDLAQATKYVLTVEPVPDPDPAPSDQKLLAGDFSGTNATISTAVMPGVGDFSNAAGVYFLRTPTDETAGNNGNDPYGVWFGTPGMPPTAGLTLPTLPVGWAYEGWVIGDAGPISTGTFTGFNERDATNQFSGTENNAGPPIPGEDFFNNAPAGETFPLDVRGRMVVISIEPVPDNSPAPFLLKPLASMVPSDAATAPTTHNFGLNLGSFPTGSVSRN